MAVFADWRDVMDLPITPDSGRAFLLAMGLGAIVGTMFGGWVMTALHKLLMTLVKMSLLGAVVVIGVLLWNGYQQSRQPQYASSAALYHAPPTAMPTYNSSYRTPIVTPTSDRWWEQ